jgi:hypothetical protein
MVRRNQFFEVEPVKDFALMIDLTAHRLFSIKGSDES